MLHGTKREFNMYNPENISYQNVVGNYNSSIDDLVGNYSTNNFNLNNGSDFLKFATHNPFTCGCEYHNK